MLELKPMIVLPDVNQCHHLARKEGNNFEKNKKKVKKFPQRMPCSVQGRFVWCMMFNTYKYSSMFKRKKREPAFDHIKLRPRN